MATYTADQAASTAAVHGPGLGGNVKVAMGTLELGTAIAANDILNMCKVPAGANVFMGWIMGDDLDTGTEVLDMDVGWLINDDEAADPDGFGNLGVITGDVITDLKPEVSIWYPLGGVLRTGGVKLFTAETTISVDVNVSPNAGGTGTLSVIVLYFMDENYAATDVS
jgi:hypothetical protein